ncbi:MAG TPA: hypothetical protein VGO58_11400 [Chitinophagaceae bacterium]|jgi:hypothetical protein|nr:hypothetical protein [Chitinophagaceae bacterium]
MKRYLSLLCFVAATFSHLSAQTVEFIEPRNVQGVPEADFFTYKVGDYFYVLQKKYRMMAPVSFDLQLDAYDANRKPIGSNIIDKSLEMGDANIYEGIFPLKDRLVMFKSEFSKATGAKMSYIYYYPFDVNGRRQKKTQLSSFMAESAMNSGNFSVNTSPDGTKVAVISELPFDKEGMEKCIVTVFDDQFKQLWKKEYTFAYESTRAPKNSIFVNNNGTVFILKQINIKKGFDQFSVFNFASDGKTVTEKKIELGNSFTVSSYKELFTTSGDLQLAGYYYNDKKVGINVETPDGIFFLQVSASNGDLLASKINPNVVGTVKATQLLAMPDNTFCLVGERQLVGSTPIPGKPLEYSYNYSGQNFYLTNLSSDGTSRWTYKFDRDLKSAGDGARNLGIYAWVNGGDVNLLFTDYLNRHDDKKRFVEFGSNRANVIQTIGTDGKMKNETLIEDPRIGGKKGEYLFLPATGSTYRNNKIFMLATRGLELVGATVSY